MDTFWWILGSGLLMSAIALVGSITLFLSEKTLKLILKPMVALAAGTLFGGAFFHLLPEAAEHMDPPLSAFIWAAIGFLTFLAFEQILHWHHCHRPLSEHKQPLTYLILIADTVHNFVGGIAVGASFLMGVPIGISAWIAAAAHEIPQEIGDFGILIHGGWKKSSALAFNFMSALTFPLGGLLTYFLSKQIDLTFLVPFAAGNFIYIAAVDLVPEFHKHDKMKTNILHFATFSAGVGLLLLLKMKLG